MPYTPVPGARGVQQRPASEAIADPNFEHIVLPDGTIRGRQKAGFWTEALPYLIASGMAAPHLAALIGGGTAAAGAGGGQAASGAGGLLPSYGASPAIQAAGMGLPSASMMTPAAAMAGGSNGGVLSRILGGGGGLSDVLKGLRDYGPLALAGLSAGRGLTQGQTDAEKQLNEILNMAKGRITATEPLFNQLNTMATRQMPRYTRGGQ